MKLYCVTILLKKSDGKAFPLCAAHELMEFGFFQRGSVKEFMDFTSKLVVERIGPTDRTSIKEGDQEYMCHAYLRSDNLAGVILSDTEYPRRTAHTIINKLLDDFTSKYPVGSWPSMKPNSAEFPQLQECLKKYQDPKEADPMLKIQADLDETKIILHDTIEKVLERGENLDKLVEQSEGLSLQSRAFYKTARKANRCCVIL